MEQTAVEWLLENLNSEPYSEEDFKYNRDCWDKALEMEKEQMLNIIKCYHNNLFYVPLNENGEAEAILKLIQTGQIKSKL
jgi:hypothetical protein